MILLGLDLGVEGTELIDNILSKWWMRIEFTIGPSIMDMVDLVCSLMGLIKPWVRSISQ